MVQAPEVARKKISSQTKAAKNSSILFQNEKLKINV
jgi:hypothetical protein